MLSTRWSTTAESSNRHSSCRAVSNSIRVAGGRKREDTAWPRTSQRFSMGLRSGEYAGHAKRAILSLSSKHDIAPVRSVQLPCSLHHFNRAPLDWTDRRTQTRDTRANTPFICNLRRTVTADIALPVDAATIDDTRVEVALRFRLATIAIYRSSGEVVPLG
ncbi:uncharacterized protein TNCV_1079731 [Trichonephila clavipes]|nr:uncharacterized protein TNCV_1079731 [Trichonephila clavipes]